MRETDATLFVVSGEYLMMIMINENRQKAAESEVGRLQPTGRDSDETLYPYQI